MSDYCRIELFGGLRLVRPDHTVRRFRTQKTASLLAYLAFYRSRLHSREELMELLWADEPVDAARHNLRQSLLSLRRQLEPPGVEPGAVLIADRRAIGLNTSAVGTDVGEFEAVLGTTEETPQRLEEAVRTYGEGLLPGFNDDWVRCERERLAELFFGALHRFAQRLETAEERERAIQYARRAVSADLLREAGHLELMRLYAAAGQPDVALRQYRELERLLQQRLECAPSHQVSQLAREIETALRTPHSRDCSLGPDNAHIEPSIRSIPEAVPAGAEWPRTLQEWPVPAGTVTFLLMSIVGAPDRAEQEAEHRRRAEESVLRRLAREHGGLVLDPNQSFETAMFASVTAALGCAAAVARAFDRGEGHLAVRPVPGRRAQRGLSAHLPAIVLVSGEATIEKGLPRSTALEQGARILVGAHPGQILCTETTAALGRRDVPGLRDGTLRLSDAGVYSLGGEAPERLFQVECPELSDDRFPAPDLPRAYRSNVPLPLNRFFGRSREIVQICELLDPSAPDDATGRATASRKPGRPGTPTRLLTLAGPGGSGKTRLALEAARRLLPVYAGGVWFVSLQELTEAALIPEAILKAMRITRAPDIGAIEQLVTTLTDQSTLLVLDNFEHLHEEGAHVVRLLLERVETVTCLATSRRCLGLGCERELHLLPLSVPEDTDSLIDVARNESVQLFLDRAQARSPDFGITAHNAGTVASLCRRLEGLPLALELAAARAAVMTPAQMLTQMEQRFRFLVSSREKRDSRHHSLRGTLEWSFRLLSPPLQRLFVRLSVFHGGWTFEDARKVLGEEWAAGSGSATSMVAPESDAPCSLLDALEQLRDWSLVLAEPTSGGMRFRMLVTLREYAEEELSPEERLAAVKKHAHYYFALAEEAAPALKGRAQTVWLTRLEPELENLRAAFEWIRGNEPPDRCVRFALALAPFLYHQGYWSEARNCLLSGSDAALRATGDCSELRARIETELGSLLLDTGELSEARSRITAAVALARKLDDPVALGEAINLLGVVHVHTDEPDAAAECFHEVLRLSATPRVRALSLHNLARLASRGGSLDEACRLYREALVYRRAAGDRRGMAETLQNLGAIAHKRADVRTARRFYRRSLLLYRSVGYTFGIGMMLNNLAELAELEGSAERALPLFVHAELILGRLGCRHARVPTEALRRLSRAIAPAQFQQLRLRVEEQPWEACLTV